MTYAYRLAQRLGRLQPDLPTALAALDGLPWRRPDTKLLAEEIVAVLEAHSEQDGTPLATAVDYYLVRSWTDRSGTVERADLARAARVRTWADYDELVARHELLVDRRFPHPTR